MDTNSRTVIPLIGAPNSGKSTLFNWLTGAKQRTVNYPGSTVEYSRGSLLEIYKKPVEIIDTPGIYSLFPKTSDEEVTVDILKANNYKKVILVIDATQLQRHLYIYKQLQEAGYDIIIAMMMTDLLKKSKKQINIALLEQELSVKIIPIEGRLGAGVKDLAAAIDLELGSNTPSLANLPRWNAEKQQSIQDNITDLMTKITVYPQGHDSKNLLDWTFKLDKIFLHSFLGISLFIGFMFFVFASIFWFAAPFMDFVDGLFGSLGEYTLTMLPDSLIGDFLANGVIASIGAFAVFAPQIFILFFLIGVLEDSGYLARAASLVDRFFSKIGMNGKAFVPLLSGFACAVPAMMATRTIENKKERWITMFILPIMTCSARLPVYALFIAFLFHDNPLLGGVVMALVYFLSLSIGLIFSSILNFFIKDTSPTKFILELPLYRVPMWRNITFNAYKRMMSYLTKAGPVIFVLALIIWLASTFPNYKEEDPIKRFDTSYAASIGHVIEPVFAPMGGDWRIGAAMVTTFAAREVFVGTLAVLFKVTDEDEDAQTQTLLERMKGATHADGSPLFTLPLVVSLMVFFIFALQCIATFAIAKKEMNSTKFAVIQLVTLNVIAYIMAVATYQILSVLI
ncbi:MAG: ferrous iron transport protein B [Bdellovibrionales bacterium]|nr:ferrous iron transport protein B [Bdellovibrionales bacterium]